MSVKIQINSLEALERLIGGDSEFEIEMRHSVAAAFAKKHLGSTMAEVCNKEVQSVLFDGRGWSGNTLKPEIKKKIEGEINTLLDGSIIPNVLAKLHIEGKIHDSVINRLDKVLDKSYIDETIDRLVKSYVKLRVAEIVNKIGKD